MRKPGRNGMMQDEIGTWQVEDDGAVLVRYTGTEKVVHLPEDCVEIGREAFCQTEIREVILPENLRIIGPGAFRFCVALKRIVLPEGIRRIEDSAFWGCCGLEEAILPESLWYIGPEAFAFTAVTRPVFPRGLRMIDREAFSYSKVEELTLRCIVGSGAFLRCKNLKRVTLESALIGNGAFEEDRKLKELELREGVRRIGDKAFRNCTGLEEIFLPESVDELGGEVFLGINGCKVSLPEKLRDHVTNQWIVEGGPDEDLPGRFEPDAVLTYRREEEA